MAFNTPLWSYVRSKSPPMNPGVSSDFDQPAEVHRDTSSTEVAASLVPHQHPPLSPPDDAKADPASQFLRLGASLLRLRFFSTASQGTATAVVSVFPKVGRIGHNVQAESPSTPYIGTGQQIASLALTFSGTTGGPVHPVTGETTAGVTWYGCSSITDTIINADVVKLLEDNYDVNVLIDMLQYNGLYVSLTVISAGRIVVEAARVS